MTDIVLSLLGGHVAHGRYLLSFQASENTFHWRVVVAINSATHALMDAVSPEPLAIRRSLVIRHPVRRAFLPNWVSGFIRPLHHAESAQVTDQPPKDANF